MIQSKRMLMGGCLIAFMVLVMCAVAALFPQSVSAVDGNEGFEKAYMNVCYPLKTGKAGEDALKLEFEYSSVISPKVYARWSDGARYDVYYQYKIDDSTWFQKTKAVIQTDAESVGSYKCWSWNPADIHKKFV